MPLCSILEISSWDGQGGADGNMGQAPAEPWPFFGAGDRPYPAGCLSSGAHAAM
jgi:hypothetical protein